MSDEIRMSVSSMTRTDKKKGVYVLFTDKERTAEFVIPEFKLVSVKGFSKDEVEQLREYIKGEQDMIMSMAKTVNPMKAMMKD